jgi:hypothetical protein
LNRAIKQVNAYLASLRNKAIKGYVVTRPTSDDGFDFYAIDIDEKPKQIPSSEFLKLASLTLANRVEKKAQNEEDKKETINDFRIVCFVLAALTIEVVNADFWCSRNGIELLTTERMAFIGAAITLVVAPFVQKIKCLE